MDKLKKFMEKIGFEHEEQEYIANYSGKYVGNIDYRQILKKFDEGVVLCSKTEDELSLAREITKELKSLVEKNGDNFYTVKLLFLIEAALASYQRYAKKELPEDLFYKNYHDLKIKLNECRKVYNVIGVFSGFDWFIRFYIPNRFWLGRLQFEPEEFICEAYEKDGFALKKGDDVINIHIPSGSPLNEAELQESFKLAYDFFKEYQKDSKLVFVCRSWLLFEKHREFLKPESNICTFMNEFDIIDTWKYEGFPIAWIIYGKEGFGDVKDFPEKTSLQKAYKKWISEGNNSGYSYGIKIYSPNN